VNVKSGVTTTALTPIKKTWTITCDSDTYLTYKAQDNRSGTESAVASQNFGLGLVNGTGKIGYYTVVMSNAKIDNVSSNILCIQTDGTSNCTTTSRLLQGELQGWSNADKSLKAGKTFSADLEVSAVLAGTTTMNGPITEDTQIDGSMTMNFAFGI
ncbi:TPA: fimbrial assembly protein, partial [Yersinia enterocolitica]